LRQWRFAEAGACGFRVYVGVDITPRICIRIRVDLKTDRLVIRQVRGCV
jgi:hypothetical protein